MCMLQSDTMVTEGEPTDLVKVLHLLVLSFSWGMQVWVSFIAGMRRTVMAAPYNVHSRFSTIFRFMTLVLDLDVCACRFCIGVAGASAHLWPGAE